MRLRESKLKEVMEEEEEEDTPVLLAMYSSRKICREPS